jgi:hypothetical protein
MNIEAGGMMPTTSVLTVSWLIIFALPSASICGVVTAKAMDLTPENSTNKIGDSFINSHFIYLIFDHHILKIGFKITDLRIAKLKVINLLSHPDLLLLK